MLGGTDNFQEEYVKVLNSLLDDLFFFNTFKAALNAKVLKQKEIDKIKSFTQNYGKFKKNEKKFVDYFENNFKIFKDLESDFLKENLISKLVTIINIFGFNKYEIINYYSELKQIENKEFPNFFTAFIKQLYDADKNYISKEDLAKVQEFRKQFDFKDDFYSDKYLLRLLKCSNMDFFKAFQKHSVIECAKSD